jgi:solute carrier family 35 protein E3
MRLQFFIVLSCLISVSVNFSTFLVIGKTSPVTYQVLGHLKTCLVLAFGYVLLRDPFSWRNILGILIAVVGMVLYSYCCTIESQQKQNEVPVKLPEVIIFPFLYAISKGCVGLVFISFL